MTGKISYADPTPAAPRPSAPEADRLTTGWKIAIVAALLGATCGGGNAERGTRSAKSEARRARNEARRANVEAGYVRGMVDNARNELTELRARIEALESPRGAAAAAPPANATLRTAPRTDLDAKPAPDGER